MGEVLSGEEVLVMMRKLIQRCEEVVGGLTDIRQIKRASRALMFARNQYGRMLEDGNQIRDWEERLAVLEKKMRLV